ncbi:methyl-accepting chemotaxis sensory transducer with Cache sensor [Desulfobulbus propionicus DSM 2032]|uniref:Methyl-accepting chemotaxis sensory transducer with Cache sensor n=1 Tax=Desulfobulbus propionicus (strain ATCC 33891 / DSM 2032 / VKM B-1956 / 1pr3) TaxID=577650 RepID=A0A7U4DPY1_DESPD|nr:methyl-accepting chemotaxis protein [Desulfobulbus propionicus]ADW18646.1 methyl-accepting chemotaxis sensory transducer with Cache sensor [Desulfobulbus propionicus DSM 2032]
MKINVHSIQFKLLTTGLLSVLVPLLIVGYFSVTKSSNALMELSKEKAQTMAGDMALLVGNLMHAEKETVAALGDAQMLRTSLEKLAGASGEEAKEIQKAMFTYMQGRFKILNESGQYQGIYITDASGQILTGVLDSGEEYGRVSVAENMDFRQAKQKGEAAIGDMLRSQATSQPVVPLAAPVRSASTPFLGAVGLVLKADYFTRLVAERKVGTTGYAYMTNKEGIILAHPKAEHVLKLDVTTIKEMAGINELMLSGKSGVAEYVFTGLDKIAGCAPVGVNGWSVAVTQNAEEFLLASTRIRDVTLTVIGVALVLVTLILIVSIRRIVRPINAAVAGLKDIAQGEGDLTMRLAVVSKDEVGELATWFNVFIDKLQHIIRDVAAGVHTLSSSSTELSQISEQMNQGSQQASNKANTVATAAEEMSANMNNVAAAMEQSTTNTNIVATASEEMSSTIGEIAQHAEKARVISDNAAKKAHDATNNINELGESAKSIGKVIETITEISEQVNLLALNATIEAARAGEAGRGFAVVANEIKELAKQTAAATYDIKDKVGSIQGTTARTVQQISEINEVITDVNEVVGSIATAVEEQTAATAEIASNVNQMAQGINEVNENVNQSSVVATEIAREISDVSTIAGEMFTSSSQVSTSAHDLSALAEQLNQMVGQFKTE